MYPGRSRSHFTTGGLPSLSSFWREAPWDLRRTICYFQLNTCSYSPYVTSSLTRGWVCCFGPRQHSHSQVRVQRDSWPYFTVSDSRLPQPGGPGPRVYIPQEQGGPAIPPGTGFPFIRLLRLAGLHWRYLTPMSSGGLWKLLWLATGWTNKGSGSSSPGRVKNFTSPYRPDRLWGPPNPL
jgi:hypothetical protein